MTDFCADFFLNRELLGTFIETIDTESVKFKVARIEEIFTKVIKSRTRYIAEKFSK